MSRTPLATCLELAQRLGVAAETVVELWAERAAIREYDAGQPRAAAEAAAVEDVRALLASPIVVGERKGPRGAAPSTGVGDMLADTHKR